MNENKFESWAIVELFGHSKVAGFISEASIGGSSFVRIDVPKTSGCEAYTKFFGGSAIYAITPTTEKLAKIAAENIQDRPVDLWVIPEPPPELKRSLLSRSEAERQVDGLPVNDGKDDIPF